MSNKDDYSYNTANDDNQQVSSITLNCLMNQDHYGKYLEDKLPKNKKLKRKDHKFYKKRFLDMTRQLLTASITNNTSNINNDIQIAFEKYIDTCIDYFKITDKTDIIQGDHEPVIVDSVLDNISMDISINTAQEADKELLMSNTKIIQTNNTLDTFVKVKTTRPREKEIIPVQKNINLKDPALKNKGIRKKKNITNKYDADPESSF